MRNIQEIDLTHFIPKRILFTIVIFFHFMISLLQAQTNESTHFEIIGLSDGVYAVIHSFGGQAICNSGIVDLGDKILIFDTFLSLEAANDLKKIISEKLSKPINYIINSHHHNDHIRGNQVFKPDVVFITASSTRKAIEQYEPNNIREEGNYAPARLAELEKEMHTASGDFQIQEQKMWLGYFQALVESHSKQEVTLSDITFEENLTIYGTERDVELFEFSGHTNCDVVMYLPKEQILFTGDLVFIGCHPFLADGEYQNLRSSLNKLMEMDVEKVVPGHGTVGTKDDITRMIEYIEVVYNLSKDYVEKGKDIEQVADIKIPLPFDTWFLSNFFTINIRFMYKTVFKEINQPVQ
ncbi:MAG: MBL fold metallo-hydrolase [Bacteroidia bacterium]|nr:MBL fold metallo-hydrolase [Bacteroidia bacterium]